MTASFKAPWTPAFDDDFGPWFTVTEAAPMVGVHSKTLQQMCAAGRITCKRNSPDSPYLISARTIAEFNRSTTRKARP